MSNSNSHDVENVESEELSLRKWMARAYLDLMCVHRTVDKRVVKLFKEEGLEGITPAQCNLLMTLLQNKNPMTASKLSEVMVLSEVTVGRFVHALEKNGWVSRRPSPQDARARLLVPTSKTKEFIPRFIRVFNQTLDEVFSEFKPGELQMLIDVMSRVQSNLQPLLEPAKK